MVIEEGERSDRMGKKPYPYFKGKKGYSIIAIHGQELALTRSQERAALKRAKRLKKGIATEFHRISQHKMSGVDKRSIKELSQVLTYQKQLKKNRRKK